MARLTAGAPRKEVIKEAQEALDKEEATAFGQLGGVESFAGLNSRCNDA